MNGPHIDPAPPRKFKRIRRGVLLALIASLACNLVALFWYLSLPKSAPDETKLIGDERATDKIAVVRLTGTITDGTIGWTVKQLERASTDPHVKAIIFRVDSPGGTIMASDELYKCLVDARDNTGRRWMGSSAKPLITSMGTMAASGGYYTAVAGHPILAERTTITGSIGVFAALPNAAEFGAKHGIKVELIKAGGIKASGSMFHTMTPSERQPWQDLVDDAYQQFLGVITGERPELTADKLANQSVISKEVPKRDDKGNVVEGMVKYTRVRADGGTYTATQAKSFGLIDEIGDLPEAIRIAAEKAGLTKFKAVTYERPKSWSEQLTGFDLGVSQPDWRLLSTPRLWYLVPNAEMVLLEKTN